MNQCGRTFSMVYNDWMHHSSESRPIDSFGQHGVHKRLPWALAMAAIAISLAGVVLRLAATVSAGDMARVLSHVVLNPFVTISYALVGALVASRRPDNVIGWMFTAVALIFSLYIGATALGDLSALFVGELHAPGPPIVRWLDNWFWLPGVMLATVFLFLLFPDGHLPSPRWRPFLGSATLGLSMMILILALHPGPLESWGAGANPYGVEALTPLLNEMLPIANLLLAVGFVGGIAAVVVRYRRAQGLERKQMQWLLYALLLLVVAHVGVAFIWFDWPSSVLVMELSIAVSTLTVLGIAVAAAIAILRYRLYDIDVVVNRTLVYTTLTASVVTLYVVAVGGLGWLFQARGNPVIGLLATGLVAVLFQPLSERLQRAVNRLFYGRRDDPLDALAQLGRRLEGVIAPEVVLPTLVDTIAQTLKLPYVAIRLHTGDGPRVVAQSGEPTSSVINWPLVYQGQTLGQLIAGRRAAGEPLSGSDRRLLTQIALQAGPAVHAVQLTAALQASRRQLINAREEERRRLRRDLHDGLGATLAGLHLEAGVLRRLIGSEPQRAEAFTDEFRSEIREAIAEIRRLVYDLRPPNLDQLGLAAAVRSQAAQCSRAATEDSSAAPGETALQVDVDAPEELPPLPAAVEVAAFRIVQEAMTNVLHHARARRCRVRLQLNGALRVEITDDGIGLLSVSEDDTGLGLHSMRERAEELGGRCEIGPAPEGGTRVLAVLPLSQDVPALIGLE